ncbi:MAG: hypothetical protein ED557_02295 [Balneola sp.]|nr:MAG: hypothetical protein ED557_02295 [Balneola sp.]
MSTSKSNIFHSFGLALQEALDRTGVTPAWLSREVGKDKGQISKYINGKSTPKRITQLELLKPLPFTVNKDGKNWVLEEAPSDEVNETQTVYSSKDSDDSSVQLKDFFEDISKVEKLYTEALKNKNLSEDEKKLQIELIEKKINALIKSKLGREK